VRHKIFAYNFFYTDKKKYIKREKEYQFTEKHNPIVDAVLDYIDKHFKEQITLSNTSRRMGYSPYHISHLFKKFTGLSFKALLANRRTLEAKHIFGRRQQ